MPPFLIREAFADDFEEVFPLLTELNVPHISKETFRRIFHPSWKTPRPNCGYVLTDGGRVQGFLGTLFADRTINGRDVRFCNMTSWIVRPEARSSSIGLLLELLRLPEQVVTNFTASPTVAKLLEAMKFSEIQRSQRIIAAVPGLSGRRASVTISPHGAEIAESLEPAERLILEDHQRIGCLHALVETGGEQCYLVLKRLIRERVPLLRPHYVSNAQLFRKVIGAQCFRMALPAKALGVIVDERYLNGCDIRWSRTVAPDARWFFRGEGMEAADVDTIYSEMVLLHA